MSKARSRYELRGAFGATKRRVGECQRECSAGVLTEVLRK